jgi:hypothetical protein
VPASLFTGPVQASLLTLRCMRKTLHTLPLPLAAAAHAATLRFRDRDACRAVLNAGRTDAGSWGDLPPGVIVVTVGAGYPADSCQ